MRLIPLINMAPRLVRSLLIATLAMLVIVTSAGAEGPLVVAHRGASDAAPENTLAAVRLAWEEGADAVEADFHLTVDGKVACLHDADTSRVTRGATKLVAAHTPLARLRKLDVGAWKNESYAGERVPTLDEVLRLTPSEKQAPLGKQAPAAKAVYIEIKCGPEIIPAVKATIEASGLAPDQVRIISFKQKVIAAAKAALPEVEAYWLVSFEQHKDHTWRPTTRGLIETAQRLGADGVDVQANKNVVDRSFVAACRDEGLSLHVWTVNDMADALHFAELGVDSITTNKPGEMLTALRTKPHEQVQLSSGAPAPNSVAQVAAPTHEAASPSEAIFFDDFGAGKLDRDRWNVYVTGESVFNNEAQAYVDSPEVLQVLRSAPGADEGALQISAVHRPAFRVNQLDRTFDFQSARIHTKGKFEFTYGVAAARMKLPAGAGLWPAFWLLGLGEWPACGEIDVLESVGDPEWIGVAVHGPGYSGETPLVNRAYFNQQPDATDWHVYSVDWSAEELTFRVDDQVVYRATRPMVEHFGRWRFDAPKYMILNLAVGGDYPAKVNGVEQPHYGLPQSTVELIETGEARVLVDWVRVTRSGDNPTPQQKRTKS